MLDFGPTAAKIEKKTKTSQKQRPENGRSFLGQQNRRARNRGQKLDPKTGSQMSTGFGKKRRLLDHNLSRNAFSGLYIAKSTCHFILHLVAYILPEPFLAVFGVDVDRKAF